MSAHSNLEIFVMLKVDSEEAAEQFAIRLLESRGWTLSRSVETIGALAERLNVPRPLVLRAASRSDRPTVALLRGPKGRLTGIERNPRFDDFVKSLNKSAANR